MSLLLYQWYTDGEQLPVLQYRGDGDGEHTIQGAILINLSSRYLNCWKLQQRKEEHPVAS